MRFLIVEDEPLIARRLEQFCRSILGDRLEQIRTAPTFEVASSFLSEFPVDVVLLDLNLSGKDGMTLLESAAAGSFHTIVVSANVDRALSAFQYGVIDFVAKPFSEERLAQALARVTSIDGRAPTAARILAVRKPGRIQLVPIDDVVFVQGADDCSELVLKNGRRELHDKTLERLQAILPLDFERIHKSYLVRLSALCALHAYEGSRYQAELKSGQFLPVGRTRYKDLRAKLG